MKKCAACTRTGGARPLAARTAIAPAGTTQDLRPCDVQDRLPQENRTTALPGMSIEAGSFPESENSGNVVRRISQSWLPGRPAPSEFLFRLRPRALYTARNTDGGRAWPGRR